MDLNYARDTTSGKEGLDLLNAVHEIDQTLPIVVMTAWGSIELTVEAMRRGVRDFVLKPWENAKLLETLRAQIAAGRALRHKEHLKAERKLIAQIVMEASDSAAMLEMIAGRIQHALDSAAAIFTRAPREHTFDLAAKAGPSEAVHMLALTVEREWRGDAAGRMTGANSFDQPRMVDSPDATPALIVPIKVKKEVA